MVLKPDVKNGINSSTANRNWWVEAGCLVVFCSIPGGLSYYFQGFYTILVSRQISGPSTACTWSSKISIPDRRRWNGTAQGRLLIQADHWLSTKITHTPSSTPQAIPRSPTMKGIPLWPVGKGCSGCVPVWCGETTLEINNLPGEWLNFSTFLGVEILLQNNKGGILGMIPWWYLRSILQWHKKVDISYVAMEQPRPTRVVWNQRVLKEMYKIEKNVRVSRPTWRIIFALCCRVDKVVGLLLRGQVLYRCISSTCVAKLFDSSKRESCRGLGLWLTCHAGSKHPVWWNDTKWYTFDKKARPSKKPPLPPKWQ